MSCCRVLVRVEAEVAAKHQPFLDRGSTVTAALLCLYLAPLAAPPGVLAGLVVASCWQHALPSRDLPLGKGKEARAASGRARRDCRATVKSGRIAGPVPSKQPQISFWKQKCSTKLRRARLLVLAPYATTFAHSDWVLAIWPLTTRQRCSRKHVSCLPPPGWPRRILSTQRRPIPLPGSGICVQARWWAQESPGPAPPMIHARVLIRPSSSNVYRTRKSPLPGGLIALARISVDNGMSLLGLCCPRYIPSSGNFDGSMLLPSISGCPDLSAEAGRGVCRETITLCLRTPMRLRLR